MVGKVVVSVVYVGTSQIARACESHSVGAAWDSAFLTNPRGAEAVVHGAHKVCSLH